MDVPRVDNPASRATATVLNVIRRAIVTGELSPGEQVRQQYWAERAGASRPPLREALEILASEGVVKHGLNQGYFVAKFNFDEISQIYVMRLLLEREVLKSLRWPTERELAQLRRLADSYNNYSIKGDHHAALGSISDFFTTVYSLSPKSLIVAELMKLWVRTAPFRPLFDNAAGLPDVAQQRFAEILNALATRDRERLTELMIAPTERALSNFG